METFKAFVKRSEALQRSENKNLVNFFSSSGIGTGRVKRKTKKRTRYRHHLFDKLEFQSFMLRKALP